MKRIWVQCIKELRQFWRDRLTVALAFLLPLATLLIYGFGIRLETNNIPIVIQDFDNSPVSRTYISRLYATNRFQPVEWSINQPASEAVDRGLASAAIVIPPDFSRRILEKKTTAVQVLVDGTDVANARVIDNSIQAATQFFLGIEGLQPRIERVVAQVRIWFNPGREEALFIVPGVYAVVLSVFPAILSAVAMVREKEEGTIVQAYASDLTAFELLLGKSLAYLGVAIGEAIFVMGIGSILWGLTFVGDPTPLLVGTPIFLMNGVLFGIFIGVRTSDQSSAVQAVQAVKVLSAILLSGFIYPISNIPFPLSLVSYLVPSRYYIELTRDAFVRGTGWAGVWFAFPMLILLGCLFFAAAWYGMRRMQLSE